MDRFPASRICGCRLVLIFLFSVLIRAIVISADTDPQDSSGLKGLAASWDSRPPDWVGDDPCGDKWSGIKCTANRITSIKLPSFGLSGTLSGDIQQLSELQNLDLSFNKNLGGPLPTYIGSLSKLESLSVVDCSFSGAIPKEIGQLSKLNFLALNNNRFTGGIPGALGNLSNLYWLDLANNMLTGALPIADGTNPGLDNLKKAGHFHLGMNQLSGDIPSQIFRSDMTMIHLLLDNNNFSGVIPPTLGQLASLEVLRFDNNHQLTGPVPTSINNLTKLAELHLENNMFTGPLPDLTGMNSVSSVYMSNNSFDSSDVPAWFKTLQSLTSLFLENVKIRGQLPQALFSHPAIQTLKLSGNLFNGSLDIENHSSTLTLIDLQNSQITALKGSGNYNNTLILVGNPICSKVNTEQYYCKISQQANPTKPPYSTHINCPGLPPPCLSYQLLSPNCTCAVPYTGTLVFQSPSFSDLSNYTYYTLLERNMTTDAFLKRQLPVESISLRNPFFDAYHNLEISLEVFPSGKTQFSEQDVSYIGFIFSNHEYLAGPINIFGPYIFLGQPYPFANEGATTAEQKKERLLLIAGESVGAIVVVAILFAVLVFLVTRRRNPRQAQDSSQSFDSWNMRRMSESIPRMKMAQMFTFEELQKFTNNFSDGNYIGHGGYGKVFRGVLPNGQLIAVKRSSHGSLQGSQEFRTEIEFLSRVHHKNLVSLLGICMDQGEQMLVYEYVPNGNLKDSLTGKSGVCLDWKSRLRVVLGAAKGIAYLHEFADPPIVHRDIKSSNILLDDRLNAKVSDFGLSKLLGEDGRDPVTTQVKGTMGYLDPEYYLMQLLTEKSDVYSFGVVLLEVLTAKKPLERGRYVVREVKGAMGKGKDLYGLHELLDPALGLGTTPLTWFEQYVDLALQCVEDSGADRPTMSEVAVEIEKVIKTAGVSLSVDSISNTVSTSRSSLDPYGSDVAFDYGGDPPSSTVETK